MFNRPVRKKTGRNRQEQSGDPEKRTQAGGSAASWLRETVRSEAGQFWSRKENRRACALIAAAVILLTVFELGEQWNRRKDYVTAGGIVTGVRRASAEEAASFPLTLKIRKGGVRMERDIVLTLRAERKEARAVTKERKEEILTRNVDALIRELESTPGKRVTLPDRLEDGTILRWEPAARASWFCVLALAPILILLLFWNDRERTRKHARARQEQIRAGLPAFNDQLLLLLNSGLVFADAFSRIAAGCRAVPPSDSFRHLLLEVQTRAEADVRPVEKALAEASEKEGVREFSRITGVISDHDRLGTDLTAVLETESEMLWDMRKRTAEEKGRRAETELAFPLAILLIVLIAVTAGPAVLQVELG